MILRRLATIAILIFGMESFHASAQGAPAVSDPRCKDSGLVTRGKLLTDIAWRAIFPIRMVGFTLGSMSDLPDLLSPGFCVCPSRIMPASPAPGVTFGMWIPSHAHEITKSPFCSPLLGMDMRRMLGPAIGLTSGMQGFGQTDSGADDGVVSNFFWHWIKLPTSYLWDLFGATVCSDKMPDADIGYMSEFDPTMWDDTLAMYTHPEAAIFQQIWAEAACIADGIVSTIRKPMSGLIWCAGTWGRMYPFLPRHDTNETIEAHMLVATRGLAAMHRRGLGSLNSGPVGVCGFTPWFVLPKQQYKLQNLWPFPQRNKAQWIGTSGWRMGTARKTPTHEDRVLTQFSFKECCVTFY